MKIIWTATALADLQNVRAYIATHNPATAMATARIVREGVERLSDFPQMGRPGLLPRTRELVIPGTPYFVSYWINNEVVEILAVIHGARRWPD